MPLIKNAVTPKPNGAVATTPPSVPPPVVSHGEEQAKQSAAPSLGERLDLYAKEEGARERAILVNGASAAAATSMGAVQHGGNSFEDYVNRVEKLTLALVSQRLRILGY